MNNRFPTEQDLKHVLTIRKAIEDKRAERTEISSALLTVPEIMEAVKTDLNATENRYSTMQQIGGFVAAPHRQHQPTLPGAAGDPGATPHDIWGVLRVILGDEVILKGIERYVAGREGKRLSIEKRNAMLAHIDKEIRHLEVREEKAILELEDMGFTVLRRADVNGKVLLEVWAAHKPEKRLKPPAKPLGLPKPKGINDDNQSVSGPDR